MYTKGKLMMCFRCFENVLLISLLHFHPRWNLARQTAYTKHHGHVIGYFANRTGKIFPFSQIYYAKFADKVTGVPTFQKLCLAF